MLEFVQACSKSRSIENVDRKCSNAALRATGTAREPLACLLRGVDKSGSTVGMGGKSTVTAALKPGKYTFYCPVDGHKAAGMKGTLTVK